MTDHPPSHRQNSDPRAACGDVAGPGGPHDRNAVVLDTSKAVLLDHATALIAHLTRKGEPLDAHALLLEGKINGSPDRSRILYLTDLDGAADVCAHLMALAARNSQADEFTKAIAASAAWITEPGVSAPAGGSS
jgi:hypothetical protein